MTLGISFVQPFSFSIWVRYVHAYSFPIQEQAVSVSSGASGICLSLFGAKSGVCALVPSLFGDKAVSVLPGIVKYRVLPAFSLPYLEQS